ncbi:hypothetical protein S40293_05506 [Stachybotrys chartarum IBT 40293]|nr:hypothetical protein S40293_05506 [Stachybotrys chartarum IBT 40293]
MFRPRVLGNGLQRLVQAGGRRTYVTDADVESARRYCYTQLQTSDYDAHLIRRFVPPPVQDTYAALRALNLELVRLPELVSNPTIGTLRMKFWQESIDNTFADRPPREPICILLSKGLKELEERAGTGTKKSIKYWISRLISTRERHMDSRPFTSLSSLEDYGENTYSTLMYATLASLPMRSMNVDHLASHIGKACGIVAVLRGIPVLAAPPRPVKTPSGMDAPATREPTLLLPLDVMAEEGVKEEEVFRQGPGAAGLQDAVFKVATRANDHLITAREMLKKLKAGEDAGHEFEHQGEGEHFYMEETDTARDIRRSFGVLLEAVPAAQYLENLEKANFDPFAVKSGGWKLPWRIWQALSKERLAWAKKNHMVSVGAGPSAPWAAGRSWCRLNPGDIPSAKFLEQPCFFAISDHDCLRQPTSSVNVVKMLYELIAIVRPGSLTEVKEIASTVGSLVIKNGGVIRGINNWGVFSLPKPVTRHQIKQTHGHYFVMRYDSSSKVHQDIRSTLSLEPRMIRTAHVKLGDGKLETLARFGAPRWKSMIGEH